MVRCDVGDQGEPEPVVAATLRGGASVRMVEKRSKSRGAIAGGIPGPSSLTSIATWRPDVRTEMVTADVA